MTKQDLELQEMRAELLKLKAELVDKENKLVIVRETIRRLYQLIGVADEKTDATVL